ncbi:glycerol-3-phosphate dehydrogenase/oxidase [Paracoccus marinaquae]|uniref:Glycerol-3-phosphate dehydrogenase/oxidase n=1 Tax=Paracoccus marinaquae TaxID=2841926 RepID=A0ABS6ALG2_9RHOB|nr:glycerol-3-phosphate dehydrogenase/oxidase [Paracoccus marinaquae]MBU3030727.1 glycerol-3-phosphate dehydrogenase/oxidase [Paracoccus marinaquae]
MGSDSPKDIIVVGGGINGAAIARGAALRGLGVLLLEADDFGAGASGHNGRMIHGGLRYLETAQIGLVREALRERAVLQKIAPHIVHPQTLMIPRHKGGGHPDWKVRLGLLALDILAMGGAPRHRSLSRAKALQRVPSLRDAGLNGAYVMHDAFAAHAERLTIEHIVDAAEHGTDLRNRCRVVDIRREAGALTVRWSGATGAGRCTALAVVNATGAWADEMLSVATVATDPLVTKAMGSFVVLRRFDGAPDEAVFFEARSDGRPVIMVPWLGNLLVGTTDRVIEGPVSAAQATRDDIDYLFDAIGHTFKAGRIQRSDILYTYSGVRPLPRQSGPSHKIGRGHVIHRHEGDLDGLFTVLGGKLSTCRSLAEEVTDSLGAFIGANHVASVTATTVLPGAAPQDAREVLAASPLGASSRDRLLGLYGERAAKIAQLCDGSRDLAEVIDPASGAIAAEFVFAVEREFAQSLSDILLRRTLLGYHAGRGLHLLPAFEAVASRHLGWSAARIARDIADYRSYLRLTDGARFHETASPPTSSERVA